MSSYTPTNHSLLNATTAVDICSQEIICDFLEQDFKNTQRDSRYADLSTYNDLAWLWVCFAFYTPLCLFGIIGNTTTIVLFTKFIKRTNTSIFIIALAIVDLVVCAIPLPIWLYQLFHYRIFSDIICRLDKFLLFVASPMSALILLVIAVDRFLLIYLGKTNAITPFRAKAIVAALALLCVGLATSELLVYTTIHRVELKFCPEIYFCNLGVCTDTEYSISRWTYLRLIDVSLAIFALTFIAIPVMYGLIFVKVYRMYKTMSQWRNNSSGGSHCKSNGESANTLAVEDDHLTFASAADEQNNTTIITTVPEQQSKQNSVNERQNLVKSASSKKKPAKKLPHLRTAITLLLVTVTFAITYGPFNIIRLISEIEGPSSNQNEQQQNLERNNPRFFFYHFLYINHVANPIIYAFLNPHFKKILKNMARKLCMFRCGSCHS